MSDAPERIWINKVHGLHPEDWDFTDGTHMTRRQLADKIEYVRVDYLQGIFARYSKVETDRIEELEAERNEADVAALERILKERGRVFDAMVDAAEDAAGKNVSFNVVVGRAIRAALAELKGEQV